MALKELARRRRCRGSVLEQILGHLKYALELQSRSILVDCNILSTEIRAK